MPPGPATVMKRLDSEVALVVVPSLLNPALPEPPDKDDFTRWALSHQTLSELWNHCDRADWLKWLVDASRAWKIIQAVDVASGVSTSDLRARIHNPFETLDQAALAERRLAVSCWLDEEGHFLVTFNSALTSL